MQVLLEVADWALGSPPAMRSSAQLRRNPLEAEWVDRGVAGAPEGRLRAGVACDPAVADHAG